MLFASNDTFVHGISPASGHGGEDWESDVSLAGRGFSSVPKPEPRPKNKLHHQIERLTEQGNDVDAIAYAMRLAPRDIRRLAQDAHIELNEETDPQAAEPLTPQARNKLRQARRAQVRKMVKRGKSAAEIRTALDIPQTTLLRDCEVLGIKLPNAQTTRATSGEYDKRITQMVKSGHRNADIARDTGLSPASVGRRIKFLGLPNSAERHSQK